MPPPIALGTQVQRLYADIDHCHSTASGLSLTNKEKICLEGNKITEVQGSQRYRVLVVDPPWNQGKTGRRKVRPNQGTTLDYPTMSKAELLRMPISDWAEDQAYLWLWATNSKDRATGEPIIKMAFDLMSAWGFCFYTMITWNKRTGPCPFGPYQITTEHVLFGYRGKGVFNRACLGKMQTCFTETSKIHSAKPESFYRNLAKYFSGPRLDVFARQVREGFAGWGNEYGTLTINQKRQAR